MKTLRHLFFSGLLSILPIALTLYIMYILLSLLDSILGQFIETILGRSLPGVGIVASLLLILLTGFVVTNVLGARAFKYGEKMLHKVPIAHKIYFGVKQLTEAFSPQGAQAFRRVALVEYPRKGMYVIGFVTGECTGEIQEKTAKRISSVFIPTTPNPTSGMLVLVPEEEVVYLDMSVEEGLKLVVSAGIVGPK